MRMCHIMSPVACLTLAYFSTLANKRQDFQKKITEQKICILISSTTFVRKIFYSKKNTGSYYHTCTWVFTSVTCYSCHNLTKLEFSWQIFKKYSDIKCHEKSSRESQVAPCGWTDMMKLIVIYHNFANAPNDAVLAPNDAVLLYTQYCGWYACPVSL
jgi:hypothetical protein